MPVDIRLKAAKYYDLNPGFLDDIQFYMEKVPSPESRVLELGCGTGRVLIPLIEKCGYIRGVDSSEAMLSLCQAKLEAKEIPVSKAAVEMGDITRLVLCMKFDLIIAPFRVFQNLETDEEVNGFFQTVHTHLAYGGSCILNVFNPSKDPEKLRREWCTEEEQLSWEVPIKGGRVTCHDRRPSMDPEKIVLYPELLYRRYKGETMVDKVVLPIAMRCYYSNELQRLIEGQGFKIIEKFGGYKGETYSEGPELVIQFSLDT